MRENLMLLLHRAQDGGYIQGLHVTHLEHVSNETVADHLIANGVTLAPDNNVGDKWISVKERLPDADGDYLVWNDYHKAIVGHYWSMGRYFISKAVTVTHWMPLPEPPKEV